MIELTTHLDQKLSGQKPTVILPDAPVPTRIVPLYEPTREPVVPDTSLSDTSWYTLSKNYQFVLFDAQGSPITVKLEDLMTEKASNAGGLVCVFDTSFAEAIMLSKIGDSDDSDAENAESQPLDEMTRRSERQMLRLAQFRRLTETADGWERELDGQLPFAEEVGTTTVLGIFRRMGFAWFADELSQEEFTRDAALDIVSNRLPQPKEVISAAERIVSPVTESEALAEAESINLRNNIRRKILNNNSDLLEMREGNQTQKTDKEKSAEEHAREDALRELADFFIDNNHARLKEEVFEFAYDPALDEPTPDEGRVEALMKRPF